MRARALPIAAALAALLAQPPAQAAEGFGIKRETIPLERISPPVVAITGTQLKVSVKAQNRNHALLASRLESQLESELVQHDPRFKLEEQKPQTTIAATLVQNDYSETTEERKEWEVKPTENEKGERELKEKEVTSTYKVVSHRLAVSYVVTDVASKKSLYADTVESTFREAYRFGEGAPSPGEVEGAASSEVVAKVVSTLTPTREQIHVLMVKGSLDRLSNFARGGFWSRYSEALEELEPFKKPKDEAYRQYALGLSYEAMAYGADDALTSLRFLERAAEHYNSAIGSHPEEDYFFLPFETNIVVETHRKLIRLITKREGPTKLVVPPPLDRVNEALERYRILTNQQDIKIAAAKAETGAKVVGQATSPSPALTNAEIVEMARAQVDEELILVTIDEAASCSFDLSAKGVIELSRAKVSKAVIERMRQAGCKR